MEVLSPGGSLEAIEAAVGNGCNAVYLGVGSLNARVRAQNLAPDQLAGVVDWLHSAGVRAYVTLNVPVRPENLADTARLLALAHRAGADAVIARDPLVMRAAVALFPGMEVHASTQHGVATVAAARRAREMGCARVILARELSAAAIGRIVREVPGVQVEVFVFGALCFAVSGMCLLGQAVGGRSGNYGGCSQPCRLPYVDREGRPLGYPFSMRDLDLVPRIADLAGLGVASRKIEGRLKPPAWVGCVTRWVRRAVDRDPPGLDSAGLEAFHRDVRALFARPLTSAWFDGRTGAEDLIAPDAPGHRGLGIADWRVDGIGSARHVAFQAPVDLNVRDGLIAIVDGGDSRNGPAPVPFPITDMVDDRGRPMMRVTAGRVVRVPLPVPGRLVGLAVHSSDAVRVEYEKAASRMPDRVRRGEVRPRFLAVDLAPDHLAATLAIGRFRHEASVPLATEPARGDGLPPDLASRLFGDAECRADPAVYANPSALKQARRDLVAATEAAARADLDIAAASAEAWMRDHADHLDPPDAELLATGTAAVSRVTGVRPGEVFTEGGRRFEVVPGPGGTRVLT